MDGDILSPKSPTGGTLPRSNALQNRITSVLSQSYADLDIRDSLSLLDRRDLHNTPDTRRNLRLDVQAELIQCNGEILADFGQVAAQLRHIGATIKDLNRSCSEIRKRVDAANRETGPMLDEARSILQDKRQVEAKQQMLDAFQTHFVVSDTDLALLTSTAEPVDDNFFRILTRVKKIHQDSQVLLGLENQRLGLEILEQSSKHLNAAFQKLYRWIQREIKSLDLENPQIGAAIRRALRVLAERPTLFQSCLDFFAEARENTLSNNFYATLTGAPADPDHPVMGKAIELSAHDPLRYVGDMFAWAHSATVSEREALEVLFISEGDEIAKGIQAGIESEPWSRVSQEEDEDNTESQPVFDGRKAHNQLVDRDLSAVFRQLKQRTEQVIQSHEDAALVYKIANLITFYRNIFSNLLGKQSQLLEILDPLSDTAIRTFKSIIRDQVTNLQIDTLSTAAPDEDLAMPDFLVNALHTLQVLIKSYDTSLMITDSTERMQGFEPILQEALDPFLSGCEDMARRLHHPQDSHIFALNYLDPTIATLKSHAFTSQRATLDLEPRLERHETDLTEITHNWLLQQSGLSSLKETVFAPDDLASSYNDPNQLATIAQQLDAFLPSATDDTRNFLGKLDNRTLVRRIVDNACEKFCADFERVEDIILRADEARAGFINGGRDGEDELKLFLRDVFPRTGDEIRVLLS
ncbi:oligomeric complex COG6 [Polychaeton citri CBS 116435]|uniref:Conserved oligomeric Golgi complex subunit 6 n=1 Tax=Polychaeton citri CBS 116435 TaxID=1314669 RepID=A0A9P4QBK0_9PEZI|nr:oligomeric complex COG6 [Polychaeton citri CBS 116435]